MAGRLTIDEFIACIHKSALVITVNTATVHIAAATQTPQVILYATTNPQHTPWKSPAEVLYFPVSRGLESKNEVIKHVHRSWQPAATGYPSAAEIVNAAQRLLQEDLKEKK